MSSATWPRLQPHILTVEHSSATLATGAALCLVPLSIAAAETLLAIALIARIAEVARHPSVTRPPRLLWFWLAWAGMETAVWLHAPDRRIGAGEIRHLLLIAALFFTLPALNRVHDTVRTWRGILIAATIGSVALIVEFCVRLLRYRHELATGGDPDLYLRTGGLLHHWMVYGTVEILVFTALLEFRASYPEEGRWTAIALWLQSLAIVLSLTRSLWLAASCIVAIHLFRTRARRSRKWILPITATAVLLTAATPVRHRIAETFQPDHYSYAERVEMWRVGWRMIRQHSVIGIGPGKVESRYAEFLAPGEPLPDYHGHLHNNALQLAAEFGIPVFAAALLFVVVLFRELSAVNQRARDRYERFLSRTALYGLGGFLIMGMMDYTYGHSLGIILLAFTVTPAFVSEPSFPTLVSEPSFQSRDRKGASKRWGP